MSPCSTLYRRVLAIGAVTIAAACSGNSTAGLPGGVVFGESAAVATSPTPAWYDLGRAKSSTIVKIALVLNYRNPEKLDQLVEQQSDPSSNRYRRFLTPEQFATQFGPTPVDYARAVAELRRNGFRIDRVYANRTVIDASAPAPVAEQLFSTEIHLAKFNDGSVRYFNVRPGTTPSGLQSTVLSVVGLDSVHSLEPQYILQTGSRHQRSQGVRKSKSPLFGPDGGYGPLVFRASYGFPKGIDGKGRAAAVVEDADFLDSDLEGYLYYFKIPRTGPPTKRVFIDGGPPRGISGDDSIEATLDVETVVSIDPGVALYVYEAPTYADLTDFTDMYNRIVNDNKVDTVSTSYAECETAFLPNFPKAADAIFEQGNALGITFEAATGDTGTAAYGCSSGVNVNTPADTPHNDAIGGTYEVVNHTTGREISEVGWDDSSGATGGGVSKLFETPTFQRGVKNVIASGRNIPDLAFDASLYSGASFYMEGAFLGPIGGTSLATPIFGAGLAAIDEANNSRQGYFNPNLYQTWESHGYSSGTTVYFRDIIKGRIPPYRAKVGYDQMSGIGAMIIGNFARILR